MSESKLHNMLKKDYSKYMTVNNGIFIIFVSPLLGYVESLIYSLVIPQGSEIGFSTFSLACILAIALIGVSVVLVACTDKLKNK